MSALFSSKCKDTELLKKIKRMRDRNFNAISDIPATKNVDLGKNKGKLRIDFLLQRKAPQLRAQNTTLEENKETSLDDKAKISDSVLIESQESLLDEMRMGSPRIPEERESAQPKQQFPRKRSPFSEIVDKGISDYLGSCGNQCSTRCNSVDAVCEAGQLQSRGKSLKDSEVSLGDRTTVSLTRKDASVSLGNKEKYTVQPTPSINYYNN